MRPVTKVRNADNAFTTDLGNLSQDTFGLACRLERLSEHDDIKPILSKHLEPLIDVGLNNGDAPLDAGQYLFISNLNANALALMLSNQPVQKIAIATTKIKDAGIWGNPVCDLSEIAAQDRRCSSHDWCSEAIRRKVAAISR
jgi:hypothetical protein